MEKGQIFSLDFIISMVAVIAAIGLMIQVIEVNVYNQKEAAADKEMKIVAERAADLLVAGYKYNSGYTACKEGGIYLMNCVKENLPTGQVSHLLIPNEYNYEITGIGIGLNRTPGSFDVGDDFYEAKRTIKVDNTGAGDTTFTVKVWKA